MIVVEFVVVVDIGEGFFEIIGVTFIIVMLVWFLELDLEKGGILFIKS